MLAWWGKNSKGIVKEYLFYSKKSLILMVITCHYYVYKPIWNRVSVVCWCLSWGFVWSWLWLLKPGLWCDPKVLQHCFSTALAIFLSLKCWGNMMIPQQKGFRLDCPRNLAVRRSQKKTKIAATKAALHEGRVGDLSFSACMVYRTHIISCAVSIQIMFGHVGLWLADVENPLVSKINWSHSLHAS